MGTSYPSSGDQRFEDLRHQGKFLEAFIYAWGIVESDVDMMVLTQFDLVSDSANLHPKRGGEKVRFVLHTSFQRKVEFLLKVKAISQASLKRLLDFSSIRDELVHGGNFSMLVQRLSDVEKSEYLDLASSALRIALYSDR